MRYTLAGLLIQPPLQNHLALEQALRGTLVKAGTVLLEEAINTKNDTSYIDVFSTTSGTLVLCHPVFLEAYEKLRQLSAAGSVAAFAVSKTALAYYFREYKLGECIEVESFKTEEETRQVDGWLLSLDEHTNLAYMMLDGYAFRSLGVAYNDLPDDTVFSRYQVTLEKAG